MIKVKSDNILDDLPLQKYAAIKKMEALIDFVDEKSKDKMIKTASSTQQNPHEMLLQLFSQMLSVLNMSSDDKSIKNALASLSKESATIAKTEDIFSKIAAMRKSNGQRNDEIKIVSKKERNSHYQIDVSKDLITREGKKIYMVSCYARDAYLGRYLIKRNFFFTEDREASADDAYGEILLKVGAIKERYYSDLIDVAAIFTQIRKALDGVISEIKMEEDSVPTNVNR